MPRVKATSVALPGVGVFMIGGFKQLSTELLPVGGDSWQLGPTLPGTEDTSYYGICSVMISNTQFMVIGGDGGMFVGGTWIQVIQLGQLRLNPPRLGSKCGKRVERFSDFGKYKGNFRNHTTSLPTYHTLSKWGKWVDRLSDF